MLATATLLISIIVILLFSRKIYANILNPLSFSVIVWGLAVILFINSSFVSHDLSSKSIIIYAFGFVFFVLGLLFGRLACGKRVSKKTIQQHYLNAKRQEKTLLGKAIDFGFWLAIVDLFLFLIFVGAKVGISRFFSAMIHYEEAYFSPGGFLNIFYSLFLYSKRVLMCFSMLSLVYVVRYRKKVLKSLMLILINFLVCIAYSRTLIFYLIILIVLSAYFSISDEKGMKIQNILFVFIAFVLFYLYFTYSQNELNKTFELHGTVFGIPLSDSAITFLSYFIGTFKSSDIYLGTMNTPYPLIGTFRFVYEMFGVNTTQYFAQDFVNIPFSYNTANIQFYLYYEGGFAWLIFASFIIGFVANKSFVLYENKRGALDILLNSVVLFGIFFSIRSYMLIYLDFLLPLLTIFVLKICVSNRLKMRQSYGFSSSNVRNASFGNLPERK